MTARSTRLTTPPNVAVPEGDAGRYIDSRAGGHMNMADLIRRGIRLGAFRVLGPAVTGVVFAVLLTGCSGTSDAGGRDSTQRSTSPSPTLVRAASNTGCDVTDKALAADLGDPQKLVDDAQRVCEGE
jgi:hypothetical protein